MLIFASYTHLCKLHSSLQARVFVFFREISVGTHLASQDFPPEHRLFHYLRNGPAFLWFLSQLGHITTTYLQGFVRSENISAERFFRERFD